MIAYNKEWLDNLYLHKELAEANKKNCISMEELKACKEKYPVRFYMPNFFVRIGLFFLTVVIAIFSFGLIALMTSVSNSGSFSGLLLFFSLLAYGTLEFIVRMKYHYKSGADDALIWMTAIFVITASNLYGDISSLQNAIIIFSVSLYMTLRFANMLMSAIACISLLAVIFFGYTRLGEMAKATVPFLIMLNSAIIYFIITAKQFREKGMRYADCLLMGKMACLFCLYAAGNYYVVREAGISMFQLDLKEGQGIPFGWLFWIFTIVIPFLYLSRGIQKKDIVLMRSGLVLIPVIIFTVRYYYHILPVEAAMIVGGVAMIAIGYSLIRYLSKPKHGFTDEEIDNAHPNTAKQLESLVIAQTFAQTKTQANNNTAFGGGSGGGGGAGGDF
jgi:hypothetical protein